jgi:HEAT repeat protein
MPPKKWMVALAVLLIVTAGLVITGTHVRLLGFFRGEQFFDGLPASAWSQELHDQDKSRGETSAFARLKKGGDGAMPVLMAIAFQSDSPGRGQAKELLISQGASAVPPLVKALKKPADRKQSAAMLGDLGGKAQPAVKPLASLLDDDDPEVRAAAMAALGKIGRDAGDAVPELIPILQGKAIAKDPAWQAQAAKILGQIGAPANKAVPALTACLTHSDKQLALEACQALARMEGDAAPAAPTLVALVKDPQSPLRAKAAFALGKIGPDAKVAVPVLIEALGDSNDAVLRENSKDALGRMGSAARPAVRTLVVTFGRGAPIGEIGPAAVPELIPLLASPKEATRADAKYFLETLRKSATPAMLTALKENDNEAVRQSVAEILDPGWGEARDIVPVLFQALMEDEESVGQAARAGIVRFDVAALPFLEQQLRGKNEDLHLEAAQLIGRLGPKARSSAPFLLDVLKDEEEKSAALRLTVARALGNMGYHPRQALPVLLDALEDDDADITMLELIELLAPHGRAAKEAAPIIAQLLVENKDWRVRRQAALTLGRIGVASEDSLPALKTAVKDKHEAVRAAAAEGLGGSGIPGDEVAPLLTKLLDDPAKDVQVAAIGGLGKLGSAAKAAAPLIHKIAQATVEAPAGAKQPDLRVLCITTLGSIGPAAKEAAPLLLSWLSTAKSEDDRRIIVQALGQMKAEEAAKVLEPLMRKENGAVGAAAAVALWRIEKKPAALTFLQDGLKEKKGRGPFIQGIGQVGSEAWESVSALKEILMRDPDLEQRALAAEALGHIGKGARPALKALVDALKLPHQGVRIQAARALGQFEEDAEDAVPFLQDLMNDPQSPRVREAAVDALRQIDPEAVS